MRKYVLVVCLTAATLVGCRQANPEHGLKDAFFKQVASTSGVRNFQRSGDEVRFTDRFRESSEARWRVHIDSTAIDYLADSKTPYKGNIKSTWSVDDQPILPRGDQADLPLSFLDNGLAQECWAIWDVKTAQWSWK